MKHGELHYVCGALGGSWKMRFKNILKHLNEAKTLHAGSAWSRQEVEFIVEVVS